MTSSRVFFSAGVLLLLVLTIGCAGTGVQSESSVVTFRMDGADNRGASVAASGSRVAVVWAATRESETNIQSAVSDDGGATFSAPVRVNDIAGDARVNGEQPPRVGIGRGQNIVVAWESKREGRSQVRVARSADGGRTFQPAETYHDPELSGARGWASLAVDANGEVHAAWLDGRNAAPKPSADKPTSGAAHMHAEPTRQDIFHAVLHTDGSRTETLVATNVCFCCKTGVAVGPDGATYVAWRHIYPVNFRDMAVARSADGRTFDAPVRVSEDGWQIAACPEDGPSIAVSASGVVHIAWPTLADADAGRKGIFYSYSTDGGRTFARRIRIDDTAATQAAHPQLIAAGDRVAVTWDERANGKGRIRARVISSRGGAWQPEAGAPIAIAGDAQVTYPALTASGDSLFVTWTENSAAGAGEVHLRRISIR